MGERMFWLVEPDPSAARQGDLGYASPAGVIEWALGWDPSSFELLGRRFDVLTQQVQLAMVLLLRRMDRDLRGGKREDQPAAARIHGVEAQYSLEERAVGFGIAAVDHYVCARNQRLHPASLSRALGQVAARDLECARSGDAAAEGGRPGEAEQDADSTDQADVELQR